MAAWRHLAIYRQLHTCIYKIEKSNRIESNLFLPVAEFISIRSTCVAAPTSASANSLLSRDHSLLVDEVSCRLDQVQKAGDVGSPVREDGLGGLLSGEADNVVGPVDLGVDAAI